MRRWVFGWLWKLFFDDALKLISIGADNGKILETSD